MGFSWRWLAVWLVLMGPGWCGAQPLARNASITLITEGWPPYNYVEQGHLSGVSVRIVRALQQELGRSDPIRLYPSMRASKMLQTQTRTMMFSMFRTPQREASYKWIGPIGRDAIYFYQRRGSPLQIRTLKDAKDVPVIASRQAGLVFNTLTALGFTNLDASAHSSKQVYGKLLRARAELAISHSPQQRGVPADASQQGPVKVVESDLYIAASLDFSDSEIALWQKALNRLKASGEFERLSRMPPLTLADVTLLPPDGEGKTR